MIRGVGYMKYDYIYVKMCPEIEWLKMADTPYSVSVFSILHSS
jgi:hypothetical protein